MLPGPDQDAQARERGPPLNLGKGVCGRPLDRPLDMTGLLDSNQYPRSTLPKPMPREPQWTRDDARRTEERPRPTIEQSRFRGVGPLHEPTLLAAQLLHGGAG